MTTFKALGVSGATFAGLERFPLTHPLSEVSMESDEVTALCPITGQPDLYTIRIQYWPGDYGLESKSLKLYFQQFRQQGAFCETLAGQIADEVMAVIEPRGIRVVVRQKARGGITVVATAERGAAPG